LKQWLFDNPKFKLGSYDEMLKLFYKSSIMFSDGFSRSFKEMGQDAYEIIADFEIIQKQWAKENNAIYATETWMFDILIAQINQIRPDVVYIQSHLLTTPGIFINNKSDANLTELIKQEYPFIQKILIFSGYPSALNRLYHADFLFYSAPVILDSYKRIGLDSTFPCKLLYHSFDPNIHNLINNNEIKYDFTFVGSSRAPESRYFALWQLLKETKLKVWLNEHEIVKGKNTLKQNIRGFLKYIIRSYNQNHLNKIIELKYIPIKIRNLYYEIAQESFAFKRVKRINGSPVLLRSIFPSRCQPSVMGIDMQTLLKQSKVTFNIHADEAFGNVGNMRMFEATGVGTCMLTDTGDNMSDLFEEDKEVVTYRTIDEAIEKVNYLLDHPDEAEQIAKAGQARTLRDHAIMNRVQQIDEVIQNLL
jgi:spore maturation protein CgeB